MIWLRLVHIVAGIVWVGSTVFVALFLVPAARAAGAEGSRVLGRVLARIGPVLGIAMLLTIVPGFLMYGRLSAGFNRAWVTSRVDLALGVGALASILAVLIGAVAIAPARGKLATLRTAVAAQGDSPTSAQAAALTTLETRVERGWRLAALLLLLAAGAMAVARYL